MNNEPPYRNRYWCCSKKIGEQHGEDCSFAEFRSEKQETEQPEQPADSR